MNKDSIYYLTREDEFYGWSFQLVYKEWMKYCYVSLGLEDKDAVHVHDLQVVSWR